MRRLELLCTLALAALLLAGCGGGKTSLFSRSRTAAPPPQAPGGTGTAPATRPTGSGGGSSAGSGSSSSLGFPAVATKNTTRVPGSSAVANAAAVALAVFPSAAPGTHPAAVALAPTGDWQAALAASSLMGDPVRAPVLLTGGGSLSPATARALSMLAPTGEHNAALDGAQLIAIGSVPAPKGLKVASVPGGDPFTLAAGIDALEARIHGRRSLNVIVASADAPAYAMPAAGYAAESGEPILFVHSGSVPPATLNALKAHRHARIYLLGPPSVISSGVAAQLAHLGRVRRIAGSDPAATSVAFAAYRDPACQVDQPCVHIPHSFGWAIRSPGHGYVLMSDSDPLEAAAAAALSSSGGYGPQLLVSDPNTLPKSVLNYFLNYATPGYTQEGPTAAVYNHAWLIGTRAKISLAVQAQVDSLLEAVPQK